MAFRRNRRTFRRSGPRGNNDNMRVWTSIVENTILDAPDVTVVSTLADPADFATTSGNTKHVGTLVRIRGRITVLDLNLLSAPDFSIIGAGIILADLSEVPGGIQNPDNVAFGQDEDLLWWSIARTGSNANNHMLWWDIDVKAKRRLEVENVLAAAFRSPTTAVNAAITIQLRLLFLVP